MSGFLGEISTSLSHIFLKLYRGRQNRSDSWSSWLLSFVFFFHLNVFLSFHLPPFLCLQGHSFSFQSWVFSRFLPITFDLHKDLQKVPFPEEQIILQCSCLYPILSLFFYIEFVEQGDYIHCLYFLTHSFNFSHLSFVFTTPLKLFHSLDPAICTNLNILLWTLLLHLFSLAHLATS